MEQWVAGLRKGQCRLFPALNPRKPPWAGVRAAVQSRRPVALSAGALVPPLGQGTCFTLQSPEKGKVWPSLPVLVTVTAALVTAAFLLPLVPMTVTAGPCPCDQHLLLILVTVTTHHSLLTLVTVTAHPCPCHQLSPRPSVTARPHDHSSLLVPKTVTTGARPRDRPSLLVPMTVLAARGSAPLQTKSLMVDGLYFCGG